MKKNLTTLLAACCMLAAFSMPASALEYHFDGPDAGLFGRPTSDETMSQFTFISPAPFELA